MLVNNFCRRCRTFNRVCNHICTQIGLLCSPIIDICGIPNILPQQIRQFTNAKPVSEALFSQNLNIIEENS